MIPKIIQGEHNRGERTLHAQKSPQFCQLYRLVSCRICPTLKWTAGASPKPLWSQSFLKNALFDLQLSFFIYKLVQANQMTNRWIEWSNELSWHFVPGGATEEHSAIYSLHMAPKAVTQKFNLCQLPSIWPGIITSGMLMVGGTEALRDQLVELLVRLLQEHSESPFHLSLNGWTSGTRHQSGRCFWDFQFGN